jgi:Flp pilus assembly secretin CpaC
MWLLFITVACAQPLQEVRAPVFLEVGEQRLIPFPEIDRYAVSGSGIRHVRLPNPDRLLIKALAPGSAQITTFSADGSSVAREIRIKRRSLKEPSELSKAVSRLDHTEVISVGTGLVLRGHISNITEAAKIALIKSQFQKEVTDQTNLDPILQEKVLERLHTLIDPFQSIQIQEEGGRIRVTGTHQDQSGTKRLRARALQIYPLIDWEVGQLGGLASAIYFRVFLLSLSRKSTLALGVTWPEEIPMRMSAIPLSAWLSDQIESRITALESSGDLRILSKPEIVVRAPGSAELFSGGEFPIQQQTRFSSQVQWRNYGLGLKLKVENVADPEIRLTIETELSQIDRSTSEGSVPSLRANRMKTEVDALFSQPLLLCGLTQQLNSAGRSGVPVLSQIPILGLLFGQSQKSEENNELVVVLIPYRAPPRAALARVGEQVPSGYIPLPRSTLSKTDIEILKQSEEWPWNALP